MSRALRHRLVVALAVLATGVGAAAAPAIGQSSGGDTSAVAINTKDSSSIFKLAFQIRRVTGDVVDNQNAAVAYASCNQCQTVAISIQVLLIAGSPTVFTPQNVAVAINDQCTLCDTMALAYQFAVGMDTKLKFTAEGNRELAQLRHQLEELRRSNLTIEEIQAQASGIMSRLSTVLSTELVGVKPDEGGSAGGGQSDSTGPAGPSTDGPASGTDTAPSQAPPQQPAQNDPQAEPTQTAPQDGTTTQTTPSTGTTQTTPPASTTPAP